MYILFLSGGAGTKEIISTDRAGGVAGSYLSQTKESTTLSIHNWLIYKYSTYLSPQTQSTFISITHWATHIILLYSMELQ